MIPIRRLWLLFRWGNGSYLNFATAMWQFVVTTYYLFINRFPIAQSFHFWEFIVVFGTGYAVIGVGFGVLHKRFQSGIDIAVANLTSPYTYKIMPGKEAEVYLPASILGMESGMETLQALGKLTPELKARFETSIRQLKDLREGKEFR